MLDIYSSKNYKLLLIIPVIVLAIALYYGGQVQDGIDLRGGLLISAPVSGIIDTSALETKLLASFDVQDLKIRQVTGVTNSLYVEFLGEKSLLRAEQALKSGDYVQVVSICQKLTGTLNATGDDKSKAEVYYTKARESFKNNLIVFLSKEIGASPAVFSVQDVGSSLGESFKSTAISTIMMAFVFIVLLVFYYFRNAIISFAVLQAVIFNVALGYAALGFFGIPLSIVTLAPILMLIGYSIQTDIMLSDRMLKRKTGTTIERMNSALKTGLTMSLTAIFTMLSLLVVSYYANITVLFNISLILTVGLMGDIIATWITNAIIVLWYLEKKEHHAK